MKVIFDLDGTLINALPRLYNLFKFLVPECNYTFEEYWNLKRNKIGHVQILAEYMNYDTGRLGDFDRKWMSLIEDEDWLSYDQPFEGVTEYLEKLKAAGKLLYIITARQHKDRVLNQITSFGWGELFEEVLVTEQKREKSQMIEDLHVDLSDAWMIGDTGNDILTGKKLGMKTAAVLSGFLNEISLSEYQADRIVKKVTLLEL